MWVQGVTIKNKHKLLNYLRELSKINFDEVTIIVKGGNEGYEEFKRIFDWITRQKSSNQHRKHRYRNKTSA